MQTLAPLLGVLTVHHTTQQASPLCDALRGLYVALHASFAFNVSLVRENPVS